MANKRESDMSKGITNKIGEWRYATGAKAEKAFGGRVFTIVIAGAHDVGIIASESNGIVIFDENFGNVVLSNHVQEASGYDGPSQRQIHELNRILDMDWKEFTTFVKQNPYYRKGSVPDVNEPTPRNMEPEVDRIIFPATAKDPSCPYEFPLESRREIIEFLCSHQMHREHNNYSPYVLAWNVKVRSFDTSGRDDAFDPDPQFDEQWKEYIENTPDLFWTIASDALSDFTEKSYSTYEGNDEGKYEFGVTGRSGGWLILKKVEGLGDLKWHSQPDMRTDLKGWLDEDLVKLYKLVVYVDKDTEHPSLAMASGYAAHREMMEEQWKDETPSRSPTK